MKIFSIIIFLAILITINNTYAGEDCKEVHLGSYSDMNGVKTLFCASYKNILKSPEWNGNTDSPPLKLSKAINICQEWLKNTNPKIDNFQVREITIQRVGNSEIKDRWYYTIEYQAIIGGRILYGSPFTAKILMDGTIIVPIISKN